MLLCQMVLLVSCEQPKQVKQPEYVYTIGIRYMDNTVDTVGIWSDCPNLNFTIDVSEGSGFSTASIVPTLRCYSGFSKRTIAASVKSFVNLKVDTIR